jgi:hypothetical protein
MGPHVKKGGGGGGGVLLITVDNCPPRQAKWTDRPGECIFKNICVYVWLDE